MSRVWVIDLNLNYNSSIMAQVNKSKHRYKILLLVLLFLGMFDVEAFAQTEVEPWGNITGIRVQGQLFEFETSLRVVGKDWTKLHATAKEEQNPKYHREGKTQLVSTRIDSLYFNERVADGEPGNAVVTIDFMPRADTTLAGVYFVIRIPKNDYAGASVKLNAKWVGLNTLKANTENEYLNDNTQTIEIKSLNHFFKLTLDEATTVSLRGDTSKLHHGDYLLYLPIVQGDIKQGQGIVKTYNLQASGKIDNAPVTLKINTLQSGRLFAGFGGNFRIQNPKTDPQVIDYSLNNLRVAWGRVEMPWRFWQPVKDSDPTENAKDNKLHPAVQKAMEMAQRLSKMKIPVILTAWSAPDWAIEGTPRFRHKPGEPWGNPLNYNNINAAYKSIADYIVYLHNAYGVDVKLFSFNESDLGINIRQTGLQHADLIKGLGAYFVSRGLKTKLLLGDNSDATTYEFIYPAMADPAARQFIGAISFHSWRGWETSTLQKWADAAKKMNLPLIVGEGSIDAAAWNYPAIFEEQTYALEEINLYTRMLAICQPLTILQWQLTADYSPLIGGGIFGNNALLAPTQRFWNLKQLATTPEGVSAMPISNNAKYLSVAALGNNSKHTYAVHMVNNGTTRQVTLTGLPKSIKKGVLYFTDKGHQMEKTPIAISNGIAKFKMEATSYVSLVVGK
jgi:hypothetical protein